MTPKTGGRQTNCSRLFLLGECGMNTTQKGIVLLLKSAVTGERQALPEGFSLAEAQELIAKQGLTTLAFEGAANCGISAGEPEMQKLLQGYYRHLLRSERQMAAVERLFRAFDEQGIDYLPLKGCEMKKLYPKPELRIMGDADILIHPEQHERIRPMLEEMDFTLKMEDEHVFFWTSGTLQLELHKCLTPPMDREFYAYYGTGWHLAVHQQGTRYTLAPEDAFIFLFTHFARHYRFSGIGCRHVVDLYVYRRAHPDMDEGYIAGELEKLHLREFYGNVLRMLESWFGDGAADDVTEFMAGYLFSGGNWGSWENHVTSAEVRRAANKERIRHTRLRSGFRAVFPDLTVMRHQYKALERFPALLPVFWLVRLADILLFRREAITRRKKMIGMVSDDKADAYRQALNYVGLDFYSGEEM